MIRLDDQTLDDHAVDARAVDDPASMI